MNPRHVAVLLWCGVCCGIAAAQDFPAQLSQPVKHFGAGATSAMAYSPDGAEVAAAGSMGIQFFNAATHELKKTLYMPYWHTHQGAEYIQYFPDGQRLLVLVQPDQNSSDHHDLYVISRQTGQTLQSITTNTSITFLSATPDCSRVAYFTRGDGDKIITHDINAGAVVGALPISLPSPAQLIAISLSPDGQTLFTCTSIAEGHVLVGTRIEGWDVQTNARKFQLDPQETGLKSFFCLAHSKDGEKLMAAAKDRMCLFTATTGELLHSYNVPSGAVFQEQYHVLRFSMDGRKALFDKSIWNLDSGQMTGQLEQFNEFDDWLVDWHGPLMGFSPDGAIVVGPGRVPRLWRASDGKLIWMATGHQSYVGGLDISTDGKTLLTCSSGPNSFGDIILWDVATATVLHAAKTGFSGGCTPRFSPDGAHFALYVVETSTYDTYPGYIEVWETATGKMVRTLNVGSAIHDLSPDFLLVLSATTWGEGKIGLYSMDTGQLVHALPYNPDNRFYYPARFSQDGKYVLAVGGPDPKDYNATTLDVWEVASGNLLKEFNIPIRPFTTMPVAPLYNSTDALVTTVAGTIRFNYLTGASTPVGFDFESSVTSASADSTAVTSRNSQAFFSDDQLCSLSMACLPIDITVGNAGPSVFSPDSRHLFVAGDGYTMMWDVPDLASKVAQQTHAPGESAALSVSITGHDYLHYQWRKDGVNIPEATAATLTLDNLDRSDRGTYDCRVDEGGTPNYAFYSPTNLGVTGAPLHLLSLTGPGWCYAGEDAAFHLQTGGGAGRLQFTLDNKPWQASWEDPCDMAITLANAQVSDSGDHDFCVTDESAGAAPLCAAAGLMVYPHIEKPRIREGGYLLRQRGAACAINVKTGGGKPSLHYHWLREDPGTREWLNVGEDLPRLAWASLQPEDAGQYQVLVEDHGRELVASDPVRLVVVEHLPAAGGVGMGLAAMALVLLGAYLARQRC